MDAAASRAGSAAVVAASGLLVGRGRAAVAGPFDFRLAAGEALLVTGPNGAGKSTFLRTLAGFLPPLAGEVTVDGLIAPDGEPAARLGEVAHHVGHRNAMKPGLTVGENLAFWARYGQAPKPSTREIADALDAVGLPDLSRLPFGYLSAGQQRRASLARLILVERPVWSLDEPTAALDTASQAGFATLMAAHRKRGGMIVAATHQPLGLHDAKDLVIRPPAATIRDEDSVIVDDAELAAAEGWL
ncbi:MAG: heme ABC exporter ATP-binding protein CcmA [Pseudomonadota bacterium]|nr:heme ABC exporter ATP-binding protein CcmA [Pseudomonadota bacterium]